MKSKTMRMHKELLPQRQNRRSLALIALAFFVGSHIYCCRCGTECSVSGSYSTHANSHSASSFISQVRMHWTRVAAVFNRLFSVSWAAGFLLVLHCFNVNLFALFHVRLMRRRRREKNEEKQNTRPSNEWKKFSASEEAITNFGFVTHVIWARIHSFADSLVFFFFSLTFAVHFMPLHTWKIAAEIIDFLVFAVARAEDLSLVAQRRTRLLKLQFCFVPFFFFFLSLSLALGCSLLSRFVYVDYDESFESTIIESVSFELVLSSSTMHKKTDEKEMTKQLQIIAWRWQRQWQTDVLRVADLWFALWTGKCRRRLWKQNNIENDLQMFFFFVSAVNCLEMSSNVLSSSFSMSLVAHAIIFPHAPKSNETKTGREKAKQIKSKWAHPTWVFFVFEFTRLHIEAANLV